MAIGKKQTVRSPRKSLRVRTRPEEPADRFTMDTGTLQANRLIADFMKTSSRVEQYLQQKGPLTALQYESIATTLEGVRTFLLTWRTHYRTGKR